MKKLSIIIPAYNEQDRIGRTLESYSTFFNKVENEHNLAHELYVVLNGCRDNTAKIVKKYQKQYPSIGMHILKEPGKGRALISGFKYAVANKSDLVGFVDADMATKPEVFYDLFMQMHTHDGIIASRYMHGATIQPARPLIKRWGSKLVYEPLVWLLFGLRFKDLQCGAKLFRADALKTVLPYLSVTDWAFDVELLYLCKKYGYTIKEVPTIWHDQAGSKLKMLGGGFGMLKSLFSVRLKHLF